jgi:uncharacterized RDD family membrane protein YckC
MDDKNQIEETKRRKTGNNAHVQSATAPNEGIRYAGILVRLSALVVDYLIIMTPFVIWNMLLVMLDMDEQQIPRALFSLAFSTSWIAYWVVCVGKWGGTPGKLIFRIKIVNERFEKPGWWRAIKRFCGIEFIVCLELIALVMVNNVNHISSLKNILNLGNGIYWFFILSNVIIFLSDNKRHRALRDLVAGTLVIHAKAKVTSGSADAPRLKG